MEDGAAGGGEAGVPLRGTSWQPFSVAFLFGSIRPSHHSPPKVKPGTQLFENTRHDAGPLATKLVLSIKDDTSRRRRCDLSRSPSSAIIVGTRFIRVAGTRFRVFLSTLSLGQADSDILRTALREAAREGPAAPAARLIRLSNDSTLVYTESKFSDDHGRTYASLSLRANQLLRLHHQPSHQAANHHDPHFASAIIAPPSARSLNLLRRLVCLG